MEPDANPVAPLEERACQLLIEAIEQERDEAWDRFDEAIGRCRALWAGAAERRAKQEAAKEADLESVKLAWATNLRSMAREMLSDAQEYANAGLRHQAVVLTSLGLGLDWNAVKAGVPRDDSLIIALLSMLGEQLAELGAFSRAEKELAFALELADEYKGRLLGATLGDLWIADLHKEMASLYLTANRLDEAVSELNQARDALNVGFKSPLSDDSSNQRHSQWSRFNTQLAVSLTATQVHARLADSYWGNQRGHARRCYERAVQSATDGIEAASSLSLLGDVQRPELVDLLRLRAEARVGVAQPNVGDEVDTKVMELAREDLHAAFDLLLSEPNQERIDWLRVKIDVLSAMRFAKIDHPEATGEHIVEAARDLASRDSRFDRILLMQLRNLHLDLWERGKSGDPKDQNLEGRKAVLEECIDVGRRLVGQSTVPSDSPQAASLVHALRTLGTLHFDQGEHELAAEYFQEASRILLARTPLLNPLDEAESSQEHNVPDLLVVSLVKQGGPENQEEALVVSEQHRAPALQQFSSLKILAFSDPLDIVRSYRNELELLFASSVGLQTDSELAPAAMEQAHRRKALQLRDELLRRRIPFIVEPLSNKDAMLSIAKKVESTVVDFRLTKRGMVAFVLDASSDLQCIELNLDLDTLWTTMRPWLRARMAYYEGHSQEALSQWKACTETVIAFTAREIMDHLSPLLKDLPEDSRVVFIPDKIMGLLPLHACHWEGDEQTSWGDRFVVSYAPSLSVLANAVWWDEARPGGSSVTILANPDAVPGDGLRALPFAAFEAAGIVAQSKEPVHCACGAECVPAALFESTSGTIHLSMHGLYRSKQPALSRLGFPDEFMVTATHVLTSYFLRTDHVVLSSCDSGQIDADDLLNDTFAFPAAFMCAGVPSVWASLWPIDDIATAFITVRAHELRQSGMRAREAMQRAQSWIRRLKGVEAFAYALPILDTLTTDLSRFGIDDRTLIRIRSRLRSLENDSSCPFDHPIYWASMQHVGL